MPLACAFFFCRENDVVGDQMAFLVETACVDTVVARFAVGALQPGWVDVVLMGLGVV